jgi:multidrug efflux pump subunit AcrB
MSATPTDSVTHTRTHTRTSVFHFFIDRPVFAMVISILTVLVGLLALSALPISQYPDVVPPQVVVTTVYPGANAKTVSETVAAPIEQQVNGVPGMLYMSSSSGNDGSYTLTVTFGIGTNLNAALVMVQNRVQLALPQLPSTVQQQGRHLGRPPVSPLLGRRGVVVREVGGHLRPDRADRAGRVGV